MDLIPWLTKLKDNMTTPSTDNNPEEAERREQLTRFASRPRLPSHWLKSILHPRSLEEIEKRSRMLFDKGKVAKIIDKKRDSGVITKLVEELRQAILTYQVGAAVNCDHAELTRFG